MDITEIRDIETTLSPAELTCLKTLHEAEIQATDAAIGRLLAALPTEPAPLILFASDHGEEFLDRNRVDPRVDRLQRADRAIHRRGPRNPRGDRDPRGVDAGAAAPWPPVPCAP